METKIADSKKTESKEKIQKIDDRPVEFLPLGASQKIRLTAAMVKQFIAVPTKKGAMPTERDCIRFIMLCAGKRANPFEGDCFLIGYDNDWGPSFSMVCGIELFLKRAEQSPQYRGRESGIIVKSPAGVITERQGCFYDEGEKVLGGWAKVYRSDRDYPDYVAVKFSVFTTEKMRWDKDPGGQIEKVALSQALRKSFPIPLGGLYTQEEMEKVTEAGRGNLLSAPEPIVPTRALDDSDREALEKGSTPPSLIVPNLGATSPTIPPTPGWVESFRRRLVYAPYADLANLLNEINSARTRMTDDTYLGLLQLYDQRMTEVALNKELNEINSARPRGIGNDGTIDKVNDKAGTGESTSRSPKT